jgi:hypothetical protein
MDRLLSPQGLHPSTRRSSHGYDHTALASIAIDIGKEVLHIVGFNIGGKIVFPRKIKRLALGDIMLGVGD